MPKPGTIAFYLEGGYAMSASHDVLSPPPPCTHFGDVSLVELGRRFGPDFNLVAGRLLVLALLRCSECRRKGNVSIRIHPDTRAWYRRSM